MNQTYLFGQYLLCPKRDLFPTKRLQQTHSFKSFFTVQAQKSTTNPVSKINNYLYNNNLFRQDNKTHYLQHRNGFIAALKHDIKCNNNIWQLYDSTQLCLKLIQI